MGSVFVSSAVDRGLSPDRGYTKTMQLVCVASPLNTSTKEKGQRLVGSESE